MTGGPQPGAVPKKRTAILARLKGYARRRREDDHHGPTAQWIAATVFLYFLAALGINTVDPTYLLAAWLFVGAVGIAVWYARQSRKRAAVNIYTVLFSVCALGCLIGFFLSRGWLQ